MKLLFISLGCDKNLVDTEHMLSMITKDGITITNDENEADVVVVNSCCFISDAMEESIQTLIDMGSLKETANLKALIVTGCLAERYAKEIVEQIPEVDAVIGTNAYDEIVSVIHEVMEGHKTSVKKPLNVSPFGVTLNSIFFPFAGWRKARWQEHNPNGRPDLSAALYFRSPRSGMPL